MAINWVKFMQDAISWCVLLLVTGCLALLLAVMTGCESQERTQDVLLMLERGKARGHLTVTTSAQLAAGQQIKFFVGAGDTTVAFDGDIDFGDAGDAIIGSDLQSVDTNSDPPQ
jgi:hypothetical protein